MRKTLAAVAISLAVGGVAHAQTPILGGIYIFAFNFCPLGYLAANGSLLPISEYTALFSLLGTTYGGDGKTTFGLPNIFFIFTEYSEIYTQCIAAEGIFPSRS